MDSVRVIFVCIITLFSCSSPILRVSSSNAKVDYHVDFRTLENDESLVYEQLLGILDSFQLDLEIWGNILETSVRLNTIESYASSSHIMPFFLDCWDSFLDPELENYQGLSDVEEYLGSRYFLYPDKSDTTDFLFCQRFYKVFEPIIANLPTRQEQDRIRECLSSSQKYLEETEKCLESHEGILIFQDSFTRDLNSKKESPGLYTYVYDYFLFRSEEINLRSAVDINESFVNFKYKNDSFELWVLLGKSEMQITDDRGIRIPINISETETADTIPSSNQVGITDFIRVEPSGSSFIKEINNSVLFENIYSYIIRIENTSTKAATTHVGSFISS